MSPGGDKKREMKETNIYEIKELCIKSGRMIFDSASLAKLIGKKREVAKVYLSRLVKAGLAKKLIRGKISFTEDEYIIATQLIEPSYISLLTALNYYGLFQQIPKNIQCINAKNTRTFINLGIEYHKIVKKLFFGYKTQRKSESYFFIAEKEKAVLDALYFGLINSDFIYENAKRLDKKILLNYSKKYVRRVQKIVKETLEND